MPGESEVVRRVQEILQATSGPGDADRVAAKKQKGLAFLFGVEGAKNVPAALDAFFEALEAAGSIPHLRAQALMDIGDWARRVPGHLGEAAHIFEIAAGFAVRKLDLSRLKAMKAMIYSFETERTNMRQPELDRNIALLKEAVLLAREALLEGARAEESLVSESFALHRLAGTVANWGTEGEKAEIEPLIRDILLRLPSDSPEHYRFMYSLALMIAATRPAEAIQTLQECAQGIKPTSPVDAVDYLIWAARIALDSGDLVTARRLWEEAKKDEDLISTASNDARYQVWMGELRAALE